MVAHRSDPNGSTRRRPGAGTLLSAALLALLILGYGYIMLAEPGRSGRSSRLIADPSAGQNAAGPSTTGSSAAGSSAAGSAGAGGKPTVNPPSPPDAVSTSPPVRLSIAAIGVDTALQSLSLLPDGTLQPPTQWNEAGWYAKGVLPGNIGPAVIAGHVDSVSGPAVFFRLRDLRVGDLITVRRRDGTVLKFEVDEIHAYLKAEFPSSVVYGPTAEPELRLITCTGDFDSQAGSYLQNLVVSAHLS